MSEYILYLSFWVWIISLDMIFLEVLGIFKDKSRSWVGAVPVPGNRDLKTETHHLQKMEMYTIQHNGSLLKNVPDLMGAHPSNWTGTEQACDQTRL